ncbi:hypothetical protein SAMN05216319_0800 [Duganella sp. CF402]|uniref:DUF6348 family protein n=1 Tax=unclassified Duganella TaxID=2636909 RepID=UPI0008CDC0C9|nr:MULTISPECIES: DUF6348 family protein [unclassified Duganella]RZT10736.1 hypothetical protein EV582_2827 [Duganella sp. BK701]SEK99344.1 hypothetical protein SAMN05216319_0800 [Duganella sp. CF402]
MFNWLKSLVAPSPSAGVSVQVEALLTVEDIFTQALQAEGYAWRLENGEISLSQGFIASVEYLESQPIGENAIRTSSKIVCKHAVHFPEGIFEFQHASGASEQESLLNGFRSWAQTDLATLIDAVSDTSETCLVMEMSWPAIDAQAELKRKIFMGPYIHSAAESIVNVDGCEGECHDFCPCCLFTKSLDAFTEQLNSREFVGVRLYASRYADGTVVADCRINGDEYPLGVEHLKKYAETWPHRGLEFRKQYVAIRTID